MSDTILITGAGSGFGEGTAFGLAKAGYNVIATTRTQETADALRAKAKTQGLTLKCQKLNVRNATDIDAVLALDFEILVNNAAQGEGGPISEIAFSPATATPKSWIRAGMRPWRSPTSAGASDPRCAE